jgi:hypothetical protein
VRGQAERFISFVKLFATQDLRSGLQRSELGVVSTREQHSPDIRFSFAAGVNVVVKNDVPAL